jgi:hypothetical protein
MTTTLLHRLIATGALAASPSAASVPMNPT